MAKKLVKGEKYLFEWRDTFGHESWMSKHEIEQKTSKMHPLKTVGFLIEDTGEWLVIAMNWNDQKDWTDDYTEWGGIQWIPKSSVKKITNI